MPPGAIGSLRVVGVFKRLYDKSLLHRRYRVSVLPLSEGNRIWNLISISHWRYRRYRLLALPLSLTTSSRGTPAAR
jgi:hypothetical protein